jgi:hypothetical protein
MQLSAQNPTSLTLAEQLAQYPAHVAYVESLTADKVPLFTIEADPDDSDESIVLGFINQESLDRVKAVLVAEMRASIQKLEAQVAASDTATAADSRPAPLPA